jgi:hypothetical protein
VSDTGAAMAGWACFILLLLVVGTVIVYVPQAAIRFFRPTFKLHWIVRLAATCGAAIALWFAVPLVLGALFASPKH